MKINNLITEYVNTDRVFYNRLLVSKKATVPVPTIKNSNRTDSKPSYSSLGRSLNEILMESLDETHKPEQDDTKSNGFRNSEAVERIHKGSHTRSE